MQRVVDVLMLWHSAYGMMVTLLTTFVRFFICYYRYSALGPVRAETRAQPGDWYVSGTLHPGQILRGSLPLLSPRV
jgi:hypothetical protein